MSVEQARRLLARRYGWIAPAGAGYDLRVGRDRRTRTLLTVDEVSFRQLVADPGLRVRSGGGWVARASSVRDADQCQPGRPGLIMGVQAVMRPTGQVASLPANLGHSAVAWLARRQDREGRPLLTPAQIAAADRLGRDAETSMRGPAVTMRWDALPRSSSGGDEAGRSGPGMASLAAARRVEAALTACGPARRMVEAICIRTSAMQAAERDLGLRRRAGKKVLQYGLDALARHYRIG